MKTYLPLGSIVVLKGATKKMMIYGRAQVAKGSGKMYDYVACLYPQGFVKADMLLGFNEEQIDKVIFTGYEDEENEAYVKRMNELLELRQAAEEAAKAAQTEQAAQAEQSEQTEQAQDAKKEELE
ncbi:MAG: DUF4176 domain-containing protein [Clostridia bacterium]|nr:DUF4176 domain-containing protein [Clostridia bacterium]